MIRYYLLLIAFLHFAHADAQRIFGTVYDGLGNLLPYASVTIKGTSIGASANQQARFSFNLSRGEYTLVCQHIGYQSAEKKIRVEDDQEIQFILQAQKLTMKEVVVSNSDEDPAYEIIRQAIKKRNAYEKEVTAFTCGMYGKDLIRVENFPNRLFGQKIKPEEKKEMGLDSAGNGIVYLSESISEVHTKRPDYFKMEVLSSRVSGSNSFGFTFPAFISFYVNNVKIFTERFNPRGFISPIADGALHYYRYKFLGTFWEDGKAVNSIKVIPRRKFEPLFSGTINITDGDWRIQSLDLMVSKDYQLEILDSLQITQMHVPVGDEVWRVKNQLVHFKAKQLKLKLSGDFLSVYSDYIINPDFNKKFFGRVLVKYDTGVSKKPRAYWDSIRPVPLAPEELRDYQVKDSAFDLRRDSVMTGAYRDSLNKRQGKLKPWLVLVGNLQRVHYGKKRVVTWGVDPLLWNAGFNNPEGVFLNMNSYIYTYLPKLKMQLGIEPYIRYGTGNGHLNAWLSLFLKKRQISPDEQLKRYSIMLSGGKQLVEFNRESPLGPLVNSVSIVLYGKNYIKTYEQYFVNLRFIKRYESGLQFMLEAAWEDRQPIENTTYFTWASSGKRNITPNYPNEKINQQFTPHQAAFLNFDISFRPGQKYIQLPNTKIPLGSKYPALQFMYSKAIPGILGSDANFDRWQFSVNDDKNLKMAGSLSYRLRIGGFLNRKQVFIQDYQHFNGNQTLAASPYLNSFQLASYYANSTTAPFYGTGHLEYHLNGLITNKIPLFNKLKWHALGGANTFFISDENYYAELFAGIENIFKIFRVDFVAGYLNGKKGMTGIRVGAGGVIGPRGFKNPLAGRSVTMRPRF